MNQKTRYAIRGMIISLDSFEHYHDTIKSDPDEFKELNDSLLQKGFFSMSDYISYFKEALKHVIGENS